MKATASPAPRTTPTTIPARAPAPRPELLEVEGVKTDLEEEIVDFADVDNADGGVIDAVIVTLEMAGVAKDEGIGA